MKKATIAAILALFALTLSLWGAEPQAEEERKGEVVLLVFKGGHPVTNAEVLFNAKHRFRTNDEGTVNVEVLPGRHRVLVTDGMNRPTEFDFMAVEKESTQIIVTLYADGRESQVDIEEPAYRIMAEKKKSLEEAAKAAPPGTLTVKLVSVEDGKPVEGAKLFFRGLDVDATTDANGTFTSKMPSGTVAVSVIHPQYSTQTVEEIVVQPNEASTKVIELSPAALELEEYVVIAPHIEGSLASVIDEQRNTSAVADVIGASQMSKTGDGDAAAALKRVTGLTVVGGKYIYVRGLGERYSSTLLNNLNLPSPEPTKRVVPLDLFPADVIASMKIQKAYTADIPGTFGGGTINIRTVGIPDEFFMKFSGSIKYNTLSTGANGHTYEGGGLDFLGYDDGTRKPPSALIAAGEARKEIQEEIKIGDTVFREGFTEQELINMGADLSANSNIQEESLMPSFGLGFSMGDKLKYDDWDLGYIANFSYDQDWNKVEMERNFYELSETMSAQGSGKYDVTERELTLSSLIGLAAQRENMDLRFLNFYIHKTTDTVRVADYDFNYDETHRYEPYLSWVERSLMTNQILGEHDLPKFHDIKVDWGLEYTTASRYEPSTRYYTYSYPLNTEEPEPYTLIKAKPYHYIYGELDDVMTNMKANVEIPVKHELLGEGSYVKAGFDMLQKNRENMALRFTYKGDAPDDAPEDIAAQDIETILSAANMGKDGYLLIDEYIDEDIYEASNDVLGLYVLANLVVTDRLTLNVGMRSESNNQDMDTYKNGEPYSDPFEVSEMLPSLQATYKLDEEQQVRVGYASTYNVPDFREFSDAFFQDPVTGDLIVGNSDLIHATISHYDVRWEWYISSQESLSVAAFYKEFTNPIETIAWVLGDRTAYTYDNAEKANNYGLEADIRKDLSFIDDKYEEYYVAGNMALIDSEITVDDAKLYTTGAGGDLTTKNRSMEGQSPYVINMQIGYDNVEDGKSATLAYNVYGRRIRALGINGAPDQYEEPFHQLDFVWNNKLESGIKYSFKVKNILDSDVEWTQGGKALRKYKKGQEISMGVSYKF